VPRQTSQRGISNVSLEEVDLGYLGADLHLLRLPFRADLLELLFYALLMLIFGTKGTFLTMATQKLAVDLSCSP
jgi:hypothetical protein